MGANPTFSYDRLIASPMGHWGMTVAHQQWPNALNVLFSEVNFDVSSIIERFNLLYCQFLSQSEWPKICILSGLLVDTTPLNQPE